MLKHDCVFSLFCCPLVTKNNFKHYNLDHGYLCGGLIFHWWVFSMTLTGSLACKLCPQVRRSADQTRPCRSEAVHWELHSLAAYTDVPAVLPRPACLWSRAVCRVCLGHSLRDKRCSGARTLSAAQNGPCRIYRQCCPNESMTGLEGVWRRITQ